MATRDEIVAQNELALKQMEGEATAPEEVPAQSAEDKAKSDALKARIVLLQEKIKTYLEDLMTTDFTVEEAGYAQDLFKSWLIIKTHGTEQHVELLKINKAANDSYLDTKLCDLIPVVESNEKASEEVAA